MADAVRRVLYLDHHERIIGGGQFSLLALMRRLRHCLPVCACPPGELAAAARQQGTGVLEMEMPPLRLRTALSVMQTLIRLCRWARHEGIALIHANGSRCMFYGGLAGRLARVPVVWHVRVAESDGWWDRVLAGLAGRVIAISKAVACRLVFLVPGEKLRIIHNGVDLQLYSQAAGAALRRSLGYGDRPLVGMVAQLIPWKRHVDFIRAMAEVARGHTAALFLIVGEDPQPEKHCQEQLEELVKELGLEEQVVFMGFRQDIEQIMAMLDVVVLTSENEPFGRVLIEAMAASRPVVATAGGGVPEIVEEKETGLLVPVGDIRAIAAAVEFLLDHPAAARSMGERGRRRAEAHFSIEAHVRAVEDLYQEILEEREIPS